jgi:rhodanese-related sulfurtransferase
MLVPYLAWRLWMRWRVARTLARLERIESVELAALIERDPRPVIVDVRSPGLRDGAEARVPGALRIDLTVFMTLHWTTGRQAQKSSRTVIAPTAPPQ